MLIALALQAASLQEPRDVFADRAWGHFSRSPTMGGVIERVDVATATIAPSTKALAYTMRLTRRRLGQPDGMLWADSSRCPAMLPVLRAMQALPPPRPSVPGLEPNPGADMVDGVAYLLRVPAHFAGGGDKVRTRFAFGSSDGQMWFSSNLGTPLADWVDHSLAALERCWSPVAPRERR
jgi:hypothetical protein